MQKNQKSNIQKFRQFFAKRNIELVDITPFVEFKLGNSGWCNNINEPDDEIYHIQVWYRTEQIATFGPEGCNVIDKDRYIIFKSYDNPINDSDFIIFKKCKD